MRAVGHRETWRLLERDLSARRLAHALLFAGPPGIGKAVVARDLAAAVLCTGKPRPCDQCDRCRQVDAGSHPDVRFVRVAEGKKEIGIEVARELKAFIQLQGVSGAGKVVVVDDAHRLSVAAQNALLKTLEEPLGRAVLILVTGIPGGLLPTVRSRCRRVDFKPLSDDELRAILRSRKVDDGAIDEVMPVAGGSAGRAIEFLELIESSDIERLVDALAGLRDGRYGSVVEFGQTLGLTEQEVSSRMAVLIEVLQQRLVRALQRGDIAGSAVHARLRLIEILSDFQKRTTRGNANRGLLVEAAAIRCSTLVTSDVRDD